jgi:hypothetical protein
MAAARHWSRSYALAPLGALHLDQRLVDGTGPQLSRKGRERRVPVADREVPPEVVNTDFAAGGVSPAPSEKRLPESCI